MAFDRTQRALEQLRERAVEDRMEDSDLDMAAVLAESTQMKSDLLWANNIIYAAMECYNFHPGLYDQMMAFMEHVREEY